MLEEEGNKQATKMDGCQKIGGKLIGPGKEIFRAGGKMCIRDRMVPVRDMPMPKAKYPLKCPYRMTPTRIVVHNTYNDAPAENEVKYMQGNLKLGGFHAAVDDKEIIRCSPFDRNTWNATDGNGPGNRQGIAIEICYSKSGGERFIQAEKNAAEYIAMLLKSYGWGIDKVTKHQDYSGKYCPHRTLDMGWQRFLDMVAGLSLIHI